MEKVTIKKPTITPQSKKILLGIILLTSILCINLVSGASFDNVKFFDDKIGDYGKVTIKDWFGLLDLAELELKRNTDKCHVDCSSETEIILYQDGALIDDVRFLTLKETGWVDEPINSYQFYIKTGGSELLVDDYENQCITEGLIITCNNVKIGTHYENDYTYKKYNLGDEVIAGTYYIKLEGDKKLGTTVDWQITSQGRLIKDWAIWEYGEYTGVNWDTSSYGSTPYGITTNDTYMWISDINDNKVYVFDMVGGYIKNFSMTAANTEGQDITTNGTFIWIVDYVDREVYKYYINGTYISSWDTSGQGASSLGITQNGTNMWILDDTGAEVYKFLINGTYINSFDISVNAAGETTGMETDGDYIWITDTNPSDSIYQYHMNGTYVNNFSVAGEATICNAITSNGTNIWVVDTPTLQVYQYGTGYSTAPEITTTLNSPDDNNISQANSVVFNCSATVTNAKIRNISLWTNMSGAWVLNETEDFTIGGGSTNYSVFTKNIPDGIIDWTCRAFNNESTSAWATNRTLTIDTIVPVVTINQPTGTKNYGYEGKAETLNWTIVDTNFDSVWYNYNGTNYTLTGAINTTEFYLKTPTFNLTIWANDSIGHLVSTTTIWSYNVFENSQTYSTTSVEEKANDFVINITYTSTNWNAITGTLVYNNTNYFGTKTGTGNDLLFTSTVNAPSVSTETNVSFYWTIGLTNVTGTTDINSGTYNQTVTIINMSICGSPYTIPFLNFTCYDESTSLAINCTMSTTFNYRQANAIGSNMFNYENDSSATGTFDFCIDPPAETYTIDSVMEYSATGYAQRYYNFEGIDFTNTTTEIGLYLLNTTSSTSFVVVVQDTGFQPIAGAEVYMQKYSVDTGTWNTVEIATTDDDGRTISHIYTEDSVYRFKIYEDGDLIHTTTGSVIACPSTPCTVTITLSEVLADPQEIFLDLDGLETSLTYSSATEVITYTYSDTSGNFSKARLYVIRSHPGVPNIVYNCNETSTSSTAVLTCDLTNKNNGTYIANGFITRLLDAEKMVERKAILKIKDIVGVLGLEGVLWSFFLLIGILMLGVYRPSLGIIFGIIGVVLMSLLQLMVLSITSIVALVGIGIILLVEVGRQ